MDAILSRLSWLLSLTNLPLSWVARSLEPLVTKLLKNWCSLRRSADPFCNFLSRTNRGLGIPPVTTCHKKAQLPCYSQLLMTSRDSTCRSLAERHPTRDTGTHKKLKPTEEVIATMMEHPSATGRRLAVEARKRIARIDEFDYPCQLLGKGTRPLCHQRET